MKFSAIITVLLSLCYSSYAKDKALSHDLYNYKFWVGNDWKTNFKSDSEQIPDFQFYNLKKQKYERISELTKNRPIALITGSITCASTVFHLKDLGDLARKYDSKVDFYTVYVRENHPRTKITHHRSMKQKIQHARRFESEEKPSFPTLVDSIDGKYHQTVGNFANSVLLIGKDNMMVYWSSFPRSKNLNMAILALLANKGEGKKLGFISDKINIDMTTDSYVKTHKKVIDRAGPHPKHLKDKIVLAQDDWKKLQSTKNQAVKKRLQQNYKSILNEWRKEKSERSANQSPST